MLIRNTYMYIHEIESTIQEGTKKGKDMILSYI